ncbi:MAG TPA: glycosyltransferase family 2 protein [Phycisphaerae bacterium]|nr:glycosyltransferase family 2 protein [Phycisphaerae bacterium]
MSQLNVRVGPPPLRVVRDSLARLLDVSWYDVALKSGLVCLYVGILWAAYATGSMFNPFRGLHNSRIGGFVMTFGAGYSSLMLFVTLGRALLVMAYRPMKSLSDEDLPSVTVIIPAYNEGPDVAKSIDSIARSHYPREKMQIIAIDDGSKDDTWHHMELAAKRHPDIVCAIRMDKNGGKRQGLRVGFALAAGDVLVTMDSDSVVARDSLRSLVTPIAKDPRIGAVAGNVKVQNRSAGILPRMMRASFVLAFDFTRAYQSKIRSVLCTPGAFSAYRRSAVEAVLSDWNNQSWMGKPSTIAEDRALTNLILREGHEIVFQSDAVVWTNVPNTYKQMARMYQRWERGNVRENLTYLGFCWKPFRKRYWAHANVEALLNMGEMIFPYVLIATSLVYGILNPFFMLQYLAYVVIFGSIMQSYYWMKERNTDCIYGVLYNLFWFTCFWWVVPYSILTANNGSWMTRSVSAAQSNGTFGEPEQAMSTPQRLAA